jgi:hypothetical protein
VESPTKISRDVMTLTHKIKLVFSRITWWLRITEKSKELHKTLKNYSFLYDLYNQLNQKYLESHRRKSDSEETYKLKGQVELLARILDIRQ